MRIAMIGSRGVPAATGGVERVVEELTRELTSRGHEVLVYARPWYVRARGKVSPPPGAKVILTPGLVGKHTDTITHTATAVWDVLRRGVDVVHIFSPGPALMSFLPAAAGRPVVLTIQGPDWEGAKWSAPARLMLGAGLGMGMRLASAVSAVSLSLCGHLADTYGRDVAHIPNGVSPAAEVPPRAMLAMGLKPEEYGLYVGRIVPGKGVDQLIRAWRAVRPAMPLVIVGDAGHDRDYERLCRREADESVRFVGPRYGDELAELYGHAAMVIQPSHREGMSLVLLEAAAHGRCVIARDIAANREALGEAMVTFAGDSLEGLGDAIMKCVRDRAARDRIGLEARKRVLERFSWARIVDEYERLYECARAARHCRPAPDR